ncbi:MAG TPA: N-acetylglucosamine-6-phosphate deacetylase [Terriglobales bacterium]|nr:N-acetylglucosamine-6-phosphate deacetylase [Terriglobales bacterium]
MSVQIIRAARALTPTEEIIDAAVVIEDGVIVAVGRREGIVAPKGAKDHDARIHILVPGFVDVHIHGAGARDVMEATPEALRIVATTVARHGTTSLVATTVTAPTDEICHSLEGIARYIQSPANQTPPDAPLAQMTGIHLEGPFLSHLRRGVHPPESLALPTVATLKRFLEAANGSARILTIAPELPGATEVIDSARDAGMTVALGHTDATYDQAHTGIEHGARHAVHVFNAMRPFSHRETGVLGAVLTDPQVTAEVIADGIHVDDPAIRLLLAAKGTQRVILVSDGTAATGMPDGVYRLGPFEFTVSGGVCRNAEGRLAGSTLTLDRAVQHLAGLGVSLREAVQMATLNPAARLGLAGKKGVIAPGADADLVLLTSKLEVAGVMTRGVGFFMQS